MTKHDQKTRSKTEIVKTPPKNILQKNVTEHTPTIESP